MSPVWVNGRILDTSHPKADKWIPPPAKDKVLWGTCPCGEVIYEGDAVGMYGDHDRVICYSCWLTGEFSELHLDCCGLRLPEIVLSQ